MTFKWLSYHLQPKTMIQKFHLLQKKLCPQVVLPSATTTNDKSHHVFHINPVICDIEECLQIILPTTTNYSVTNSFIILNFVLFKCDIENIYKCLTE